MLNKSWTAIALLMGVATFAQRVRVNQTRLTALSCILVLGLAYKPLKAQATGSESGAAASYATPDWEKRAGSKMQFEVASIHLERPDSWSPPSFPLDSGDSSIPLGGHFFADFPLLVDIEFAYKYWPTHVQEEALRAQLPKWAQKLSFVIEARAEGSPTKDQMRLMLQSLLTERFKLAVHFERKQTQVFALVLAKPGPLGPKLRRHADGPPCDVLGDSMDEPRAIPKVFPRRCGTYALWPTTDNSRFIGARDTTMLFIAKFLALDANLSRPAVDQTGLTGNFDFTIQYSRDSIAPPLPGVEPESQAPTFLEALKEQLGLKLKPTMAPVDVLVIDHVEEPSPN
jgi:bla regulator protein BlaR1